MSWPHLLRRAPRRSRRQLRFEPLEDRRLMAELAIGVTLVGATMSTDDPTDTTINVGEVGTEFTLQIRVQDLTQRTPSDMGVIALPLNISWNRNAIEFIGNSDPDARFEDGITPRDPNYQPVSPSDPTDDPTSTMRLNQIVTPAFPLQRALQSLDPFERLMGLSGASLPNAGLGAAIGSQSEDPFSSLRFRANAATTTPFTIEIAGSMSFVDAAVLEPVVRGSNTTDINDITVQTNLVIEGTPPPPGMNSLSGFVFADTNLDGVRNANEDGLPNVAITLVRTDGGSVTPVTTLTGPDGWYHFEELESGIYDVMEMQPDGFRNASISRGLVFPAGSSQPSDLHRGTTSGFNDFRGIDLSDGGNAVDFNFGDNIVPTKRRFVASVDPFAETCSQLGLRCVTVRGTAGNDQIEFVPDAEAVRVTVNSQPAQVFPRDTVNIVKIDALAGDDTVTLLGGSADDVAHFQENSCTIQTGAYLPGDYAVLAVNAERTIADGGLGDDFAVLRDSAVDDVLTATVDPFVGPVTELERALNMQRFARAVAFERTRAVSVPHDGVDDLDTATLNGLAVELVGKWRTVSQP